MYVDMPNPRSESSGVYVDNAVEIVFVDIEVGMLVAKLWVLMWVMAPSVEKVVDITFSEENRARKKDRGFAIPTICSVDIA